MPRVRAALPAHVAHTRVSGATVAAIPGGTLDPGAIPKYVDPLVIPPAMPRTSALLWAQSPIDYYEIAVRQIVQNILPAAMNMPTTVWGYGSLTPGGVFNYPGFTIEAKQGRPVRVKWVNQLVDAAGNYLPHLLPVDPTLHWANPPGGLTGRDTRPSFSSTPASYTGPVPMAVHLHGGHTAQESDGYAEAWYLPNATNIPVGYATEGSWYQRFSDLFASKFGVRYGPGFMVAQYENDERASTLWYHDHTLGMTRLNVYAGPAGFYNIRGGPADLPSGVLPGPAPQRGDRAGTKYYEIPLAIQDRSFNSDGSLFYPDSRAFFDAFTGPYIGQDGSDISPIWNPEFFGNTMVVNGKTWPKLQVEPRRYRFRLLNGCDARFLVLKLVTDPLAARPVAPTLPFWQIGTEGGFLPAVVQQSQLLMANAERADVIVDFTGLTVGTRLYMINEGLDSPFGGMPNPVDMADPESTGQVMMFEVVPLTSADTSVPPSQLTLPALTGIGAPETTRKVALMEEDSAVLLEVGPRAAALGMMMPDDMPMAMMWMDPITENPALGAVEQWELYNFTMDAHPIHLHEVQFQVVDRQPLALDGEGMAAMPAALAGPPRAPEAWEVGLKDTVIAYPGEVTRIKAKFDLPGRYVWHCHIVEHEDNEMMRPYDIEEAAGFPRTATLDSFNRPNGALGAAWLGAVRLDQYQIVANQVRVGKGGTVYWGATSFGANQEVYYTLTALSTTVKEQCLILKQTGSILLPRQIEVTYEPRNARVRVKTRDLLNGLVERGVLAGVTFAPGDQFGARALADGKVIVFKNGAALGSAYVTSGLRPWPWRLATGGGRVGFSSSGSLSSLNATLIDDVGGGTI